MIDEYFLEIEDYINHFIIVIKSEIEKIKLDDFSGIIKGKLYFENSFLDFIEVVKLRNNKLRKKKKYKYNFMLNDNSFVFRYDDVPHHPKMNTFPHHKHVKDDVVESNEPNLLLILKEIKDFPDIPQVRRLRKHAIADYRLRIGNYRVLFDVNWDKKERYIY